MESQKTIGIIGGGQLGRMLTQAALQMGFRVIVVNPEANGPAAQVGAEEIVADLYDSAALKQLAEKSDFITIEIEHLSIDALEAIEKLGKKVNPSSETLRMIQDKFIQKEFFDKAGIPVAPFVVIDDIDDATEALEKFGGKMLIKTRFGAYDGRGNMVVKSDQDVKDAFEKFGDAKLYAEKYIPFKKELAVMVARSTTGEIALYPVVETIHKRNINVEVLVPAEINESINKKALDVANSVAKLLKGAGMFGIEMFLTESGDVLVNEIAPRVHNSGHYTLDASETSQFEQHIRAVTGMPLGKTDLKVPSAVMVNILGEHNRPTVIGGLDDALAIPETNVHLYGKSPTKIDRKMGHITSTGKTIGEARERANKARKVISV